MSTPYGLLQGEWGLLEGFRNDVDHARLGRLYADVRFVRFASDAHLSSVAVAYEPWSGALVARMRRNHLDRDGFDCAEHFHGFVWTALNAFPPPMRNAIGEVGLVCWPDCTLSPAEARREFGLRPAPRPQAAEINARGPQSEGYELGKFVPSIATPLFIDDGEDDAPERFRNFLENAVADWNCTYLGERSLKVPPEAERLARCDFAELVSSGERLAELRNLLHDHKPAQRVQMLLASFVKPGSDSLCYGLDGIGRKLGRRPSGSAKGRKLQNADSPDAAAKLEGSAHAAKELQRWIGQRLKAAREHARLCEDAVAAALGCTQQQVSELEAGKATNVMAYVRDYLAAIGPEYRDWIDFRSIFIDAARERPLAAGPEHES